MRPNTGQPSRRLVTSPQSAGSGPEVTNCRPTATTLKELLAGLISSLTPATCDWIVDASMRMGVGAQ
ncbi:MAG: hypothetical protein NT154_07465 [Verrucomicrobia bacterium]|nr:hypothetical protein [Verrucomicrobiota bacterium]